MNKDKFKPTLEELAKQSALYPQEQLLQIKRSKRSLTIGIPKELQLQEKRIALTPGSVAILIANGHEVVVENGAGVDSNYPDHMYADKGANIVYDHESAMQCDIVLKVEPPTIDEIKMMNKGATLLSALQMSHLRPEYLAEVNKQKITAVAFELIEDKGGLKPVVRSMSEIASNCIISIAGEYLSNANGGSGIIFGGVTGVPPVKLIILGAGTIGENVARVARHLGAEVQIYDNHHYKLRRLKKDLGDQMYTSIIDHITLSKEIVDADVVVGALRSEEGTSLCVISEEMVSSMKPGSVLIDASISQGGCFETSNVTTHDHPTFLKHEVIHYCVPNIPSRAARTATQALSYIFTPLMLQIGNLGGIEEMTRRKWWFQKGVYAYNGYLTNEHLAKKFGMQYKDLELVLAAGI